MDKIFVLEAAKRVDKTQSHSVNLEALEQALDIPYAYRDWNQELDDRFKSYYIIKWYCTDSWVGLSAIYLDDELIAVSMQEGRKCSENVDFVSEEAAKKVFDLLRPQFNYERVSKHDAAEMIHTFYTVDYGAQLLVDEGYYNGKKVKVVEKYHSYAAIDLWRSIVIKHEDGQCETINIGDFHIPIHITPENKDDSLQST